MGTFFSTNNHSLPEQWGENPHVKEITGVRDLGLEGDPSLMESESFGVQGS